MSENGNTYRIKNSLAVIAGLAILNHLFGACVNWNSAEAFGISDKLLFCSRWVLVILVCMMTAFVWKNREMNWGNLVRISFYGIVIFMAAQILLYIPEHFIIGRTGHFSFVHAFEYDGLIALFLGLTILLWCYARLRKIFGQNLVICLFLILGIMTGCMRGIDYSPVICQILVGAPIAILAYETDFTETKKKKLISIILLAAFAAIVFLLSAYVIRFMGTSVFADCSYEGDFMGGLSGALVRIIWYAVSVLLFYALGNLIPNRKILLLSAMGNSAVVSYIIQSL